MQHTLIVLELNIFQNNFKKSEKNNIITKIYRMQADHSIMCGYVFIGFIDFILICKSLLDYINLFSPNKYENNHKIILKYFK